MKYLKWAIGVLVLLAIIAGIHYFLKSSNYSETKTYSESEAKAVINSRAAEVITALKNNDLVKLSTYVHPKKGVRFSPYSHIDTKEDLVFTANEINRIANNKTKYTWGVYDGVGNPIELTFGEYFKKFIYNQDFSNAKEIGYNHILGTGNTINNVFEAYPKDIVVEYHFSGFDPQYGGMDWASLRLVFESFKGDWYLVGVINDRWTI